LKGKEKEKPLVIVDRRDVALLSRDLVPLL